MRGMQDFDARSRPAKWLFCGRVMYPLTPCLRRTYVVSSMYSSTCRHEVAEITPTKVQENLGNASGFGNASDRHSRTHVALLLLPDRVIRGWFQEHRRLRPLLRTGDEERVLRCVDKVCRLGVSREANRRSVGTVIG